MKSTRNKARLRGLLTLAAASLLLLTVAGTPGPAQAVTLVYAFPSAGDGYASATTKLTLRPATPSDVAGMTVVGSTSGQHQGTVRALQAGGVDFTPAVAFTPGETVTVTTSLSVLGSQNGQYTFKIARSEQPVMGSPVTPPSGKCPSPVYKSRADLVATGACVVAGTPTGSTLLLGTTETGPAAGPSIYTDGGTLIWHLLSPNAITDSLSMFTIGGQPRLAYFSGQAILNGGGGRGSYQLLDNRYRPVGTIQMGNGFVADEHELLVTSQQTAILGAYNLVHVTIAGADVLVHDYVVEEIDLRDNGVLFEWHSLDHVPVTSSHVPVPTGTQEFDYFHGNSIAIAPDGDLLISSRNTWSIYKVSRLDGHVVWTLGSPADGSGTFHLVDSTGLGWYCWQHDVRAGADTLSVTMFDDGGGNIPGCTHPARVLSLQLDLTALTATVVQQVRHTPDLFAQFTGSARSLVDGGRLVSWGNTGVVTEFAPDGTTRVELQLDKFSYRMLPASWVGQPAETPSVARSGGPVYVSWNGATGVASWRLVHYPSLVPLGSPAASQGFETAITPPSGSSGQLVVAQALGSNGLPISGGTSSPFSLP
jgi:hypothetical protein